MVARRHNMPVPVNFYFYTTASNPLVRDAFTGLWSHQFMAPQLLATLP